jgi:regulator of RNase E activity RraA
VKHDLDTLKSTLYTAVIGDVMDVLGFQHQWLPSDLRGILPEMTVVGRAMPVLIADRFDNSKKPFGLLTEALDQLEPGEVYLARGSRIDCSAWGEILTATARGRGAVGAVVDGFHRDTHKVLAQDFPVFSRGAYGQDAGPRSSVIDFRVAVQIGQVSVTPGDLIFGDIDGVLVVPQAIEDEVIERALAKATAENTVRAAIERGMSSTEALRTYGVL